MTSRAFSRATSDPVAIASAATPPGTIAGFFLSSAPAGWLKANGGTIGSAASGASRANADTQALFEALWSNTSLAVLTSAGGASARGASAADDFAANKRITLPDYRGEFMRGHDDGRGVDAGRALGSAQAEGVGTHGHTASTAINTASAGTPSGTIASDGAHSHTFTSGTSGGTGSSGVNRGNITSAGTTSVSSDGAHSHTFTGTALAAHGHTATTTVNNSAAGENRPRNVAALICIKL